MEKYKIKTKLKISILFCVLFSFCLVIPTAIWAATLYLIPQSQTIYQGDTFLVEVRLDSEEERVNATQVNLNLPMDLLEIVDFSKGGSIFTFWIEEPNLKGNIISFVGGVPGGFEGDGLIGKISFLAKEIGKAKVDFREDSKVLYGEGLLAELSFLEGNYEIIKKPKELPLISSNTHPDQDKWYTGTTLHLHWDLIEGAEYSFLLSKDPLAEPDEIPDRPEGELIWIGDMEYPNLEDGIYYFSLKQKLPGENWSQKITFRAMIDSTRPEEFRPEIGEDPSIFEGKYFLSFATTDKTSGIDYYEILEIDERGFKRGTKKEAEWKMGESPYLLEDQSLQSIIKVKAVDKAGNEKIAEIIPPEKPFPYWTIPVIVICLVIISWIIKKYLLKKQR